MNETIKPIETIYNGLRFRSRLEARWAVVMDALGIEYAYELAGFEMKYQGKVVRYLPDFYLFESGYWVEVKGVMTPVDEMKIKLFRKSGHKLKVLGDISAYTEEKMERMKLPQATRLAIRLGRMARFEWGEGQSAQEVREEFLKLKEEMEK